MANYLFSQYRLQTLVFKILASVLFPASVKLAVKYQQDRWNTGHL